MVTLQRGLEDVEHKQQKQEIQAEEDERETGPSLPTKVLTLLSFEFLVNFISAPTLTLTKRRSCHAVSST